MAQVENQKAMMSTTPPGIIGDGVTNDADAIQLALQTLPEFVLAPDRKYGTGHPIVPPYGGIFKGGGNPSGTTDNCTWLRALPTFNRQWNVNGVLAGLIQSPCYSPDPQTPPRWPWTLSQYSHGLLFENLFLDGTPIPAQTSQIAGMCLTNNGEMAALHRVTLENFLIGLSVTGGNATLTLRDVLANWSRECAVRFWRGMVANAPAPGGHIKIEGFLSGDNNTEFLRIEGAHNIHGSIKVEHCPSPVVFDVDHGWVGKNVGNNPTQPFMSPELHLTCPAIDMPSAPVAVSIQHSGTSNPNEFITPRVTFDGVAHCITQAWLCDHNTNPPTVIGWNTPSGAVPGFWRSGTRFEYDAGAAWSLLKPAPVAPPANTKTTN